MIPRERKEIVNILRGGNFTIAFNDSIECELVKKKYSSYEKYADAVVDGGYEDDSFNLQNAGYGEELVELLVEALRGKMVST